MKVVGLLKLDKFLNNHIDCEQQVFAWIAEVKEASWSTPADIKARHATASFLADNRVIFNIKGNNYRLDTKVYYQQETIMIKRIGTHAEYNGWGF